MNNSYNIQVDRQYINKRTNQAVIVTGEDNPYGRWVVSFKTSSQPTAENEMWSNDFNRDYKVATPLKRGVKPIRNKAKPATFRLYETDQANLDILAANWGVTASEALRRAVAESVEKI